MQRFYTLGTYGSVFPSYVNIAWGATRNKTCYIANFRRLKIVEIKYQWILKLHILPFCHDCICGTAIGKNDNSAVNFTVNLGSMYMHHFYNSLIIIWKRDTMQMTKHSKSIQHIRFLHQNCFTSCISHFYRHATIPQSHKWTRAVETSNADSLWTDMKWKQ